MRNMCSDCNDVLTEQKNKEEDLYDKLFVIVSQHDLSHVWPNKISLLFILKCSHPYSFIHWYSMVEAVTPDTETAAAPEESKETPEVWRRLCPVLVSYL